jgi:hypothetical protein
MKINNLENQEEEDQVNLHKETDRIKEGRVIGQ